MACLNFSEGHIRPNFLQSRARLLVYFPHHLPFKRVDVNLSWLQLSAHLRYQFLWGSYYFALNFVDRNQTEENSTKTRFLWCQYFAANFLINFFESLFQEGILLLEFPYFLQMLYLNCCIGFLKPSLRKRRNCQLQFMN